MCDRKWTGGWTDTMVKQKDIATEIIRVADRIYRDAHANGFPMTTEDARAIAISARMEMLRGHTDDGPLTKKQANYIEVLRDKVAHILMKDMPLSEGYAKFDDFIASEAKSQGWDAIDTSSKGSYILDRILSTWPETRN